MLTGGIGHFFGHVKNISQFYMQHKLKQLTAL